MINYKGENIVKKYFLNLSKNNIIFENVIWLFFDKLFRMGLGLFVGVWVARYLGPKDFGLLNYAKSFILLFSALASLGLQGLVVREIVKNKANQFEILGTSFYMRVFGGISVMFISFISIKLYEPENDILHYLVLIVSGTMVFKASEIISFWFESQVQSKFQVWVENSVFFISAIIKIIFIYYGLPVIMFAWAFLFESFLIAIILFGVYRSKGLKVRDWSFSIYRMKYLLNEGWPLILAGLSIMLYMQIDKIMIGKILGEKEVGLYSVAVQISEVWYFLPTVIASSIFPSLIKLKENNSKLYKRRIEKLFDIMVVLSLIIAISMTFLSHKLIFLLFGGDYIEAGKVLSIHIWAGVFVFLGVLSSKWFLIENLQKFSFYRTAWGGLLNIGLNYLLIPKFGITGSAIATVISQSFSSVFLNAFSKDVRPLFYMQIRALIFYNYIKLIAK
ncbi:flippase [Belliella pelovolcani]|uniref:Membrane protein involved in the export of O-antigen and teichoic acid n=1 Tax=Belliella pelovolcani TaxID=529505 RepID=A0A1N7MEK5_9BACT|nr:flippase [Belliella pelovolcani]SIS84487.1 Membrane protein involved in the export of O-antigen and teichoic acid [Belliella pelovolcani]